MIFLDMRQLSIIFLLVVAVLISGCAAGTTFKPIVETKNVPYDYIQPYELSGEKGAKFNIEIKTDGAPVDILVLDSKNYIIYNNDFENGAHDSWKSVIHRDIVSKSFSYKLPETGTYYLVIENSDFSKDGADAKRAVNVAIKIE
jgi:hypothetical protein